MTRTPDPDDVYPLKRKVLRNCVAIAVLELFAWLIHWLCFCCNQDSPEWLRWIVLLLGIVVVVIMLRRANLWIDRAYFYAHNGYCPWEEEGSSRR